MREFCAFLPCSRSGNSKPVANASQPLTPLSMNFRDRFSVEEPRTAPASCTAGHCYLHPTCKSSATFEKRLPALLRLLPLLRTFRAIPSLLSFLARAPDTRGIYSVLCTKQDRRKGRRGFTEIYSSIVTVPHIGVSTLFARPPVDRFRNSARQA